MCKTHNDIYITVFIVPGERKDKYPWETRA